MSTNRVSQTLRSCWTFNPHQGKPLALPIVLVGVALAATLWFLMFSPLTKTSFPFWESMTVSALLLTTFSTIFFPSWAKDLNLNLTSLAIGIGMAAVFWGVFWAGDKLSQILFDFARPQVNLIYDMGNGYHPTLVALLLLFIIGPAEEIFWRSFTQRHLSRRFGPNTGFLIATLLYTAVHIPSLNFMLIMAAFVIGALWGLFYRFFPRHLTALIISHAVWDTCAFVIFPF